MPLSKKNIRFTWVKIHQNLRDIKIEVHYKNSVNISLGKVKFCVQKEWKTKTKQNKKGKITIALWTKQESMPGEINNLSGFVAVMGIRSFKEQHFVKENK